MKLEIDLTFEARPRTVPNVQTSADVNRPAFHTE